MITTGALVAKIAVTQLMIIYDDNFQSSVFSCDINIDDYQDD